MLKTTIIQDRAYGLSDLPPDILIFAKKKRKGNRNVKVYIDDQEFASTVVATSSNFWGAVKNKDG